ncbi:MAG: oxygen-dependent coproporphyrinogen oxidase [Bacteroidetes bacterium]|jgi:coproporphyrinogen III oxidase|nr:oxygen-dependent coproporphyrinogen oxidase [Bacteroidota bacterium]
MQQADILLKADEIADQYRSIQSHICSVLEHADGRGTFGIHPWEKDIGGGVTCVMREGSIIEKAGVNFSYVKGPYGEKMEEILGESADYYAATGISSIIHPISPMIPIIHMNVRYFALDNGISWFGGGIDLTPHYIDLGEARRFHQHLKQVCDAYHPGFYPEYKVWADNYFYIPHRNETRGVGGIFFDRLKPGDQIGFEDLLSFTKQLARFYPDIYREIMHNKKDCTYGEKEKMWQKIRRGRYVEFNLVYDRGTKFGLESGGNTESILISLPAEAAWEYHFEVADGSEESKTLQFLKKGIDWLNVEANN